MVAPQALTRAAAWRVASRLSPDIRNNLVGDLVWQLVTLVVYLVAIPSIWLLLLWAVRWVVVAGICAALVLEWRGQRHASLWVLVSGHCAGAVGTVVLLPEFAPVVTLVLVGDLAMLVPRATGRRGRPLIVLVVVAATLSGALSLQSWTGLADEAPRWVLVGLIAGHLIGTGWSVVVSARAAADVLRRRAARLSSIRSRTVSAADQAAKELRGRLDAGPARALDALAGDLDTIGRVIARGDLTAAGELAAGAADRAQECLRELRDMSHGLFPSVLATGGLSAAVPSLAQPGGPALDVALSDTRAHPSSENAVFGIVVAALDWVRGRPAATLQVGSSQVGDRLVFWVDARWRAAGPADGGGDPLAGSGAIALDRLEAVGGDLTTRTLPGTWRAAGSAPIELGAIDDTGPLVATVVDDQATLTVFLRFSAWFAGIGAVVVMLAHLVTRLPVLLVIVGVLLVVIGCVVVARRALGAGRPGLAAALLSFESSVAALSVTALVPDFAPVTVGIAVLPMVVTPPGVSTWVVRATAVGQTLTALATALIGVTGGVLTSLQGPPEWLVQILLGPATGGVAALVGATTSTSLGRVEALVAAAQRSLARLVVAADAERRRIERDLHDGAQQRIVALSLHLRASVMLLARGQGDRAGVLLRDLHDQVTAAQDDLDELSRGVFPGRLTRGDLAGALADAGGTSPMTLTVRAADDLGDLPQQVATGVYFACLELVQNAIKYAGPGVTVTIDLARDRGTAGDLLLVSVTDEGPGFEATTRRAGRGLANVADRIDALDGHWSLRTRPCAGVRVDVAVPVPRSDRSPEPVLVAGGRVAES